MGQNINLCMYVCMYVCLLKLLAIMGLNSEQLIFTLKGYSKNIKK